MSSVDLSIFIVYMIAMLGVGAYFLVKNKNRDDYYVGGRSMGSLHIGLSVVATDVGGGFSIGLGGLGFLVGISGSWMLFTGLLGAWISAVLLIPKIKELGDRKKFFTFPQIFSFFYNKETALIAGIISAIGYIGFSSSQILAGAKLASSTFPDISLTTALLIMGAIAVIYTSIGGLKAVIYTDTIQWILLIGGLVFIGIPISYYAVGGWETIQTTLEPEFFQMNNLRWQQVVYWAVTIIPIWFTGMTLYQRIYASRNVKQAKRAWFFAGLLEWPIMALMGTALGLLGRVAFESGMFAELGYAAGQAFDEEMGLPLLLNTVLPSGLLGIMLAAFFSAILSTADSCLMAASGNIQTDILERIFKFGDNKKLHLLVSQIITLSIGILAVTLAGFMQNVLDLMLYSYAFMVSGLFMPVIAALFVKNIKPLSAILAMLGGGGTTLLLQMFKIQIPVRIAQAELSQKITEIQAAFPSLSDVNFTKMTVKEISLYISDLQLIYFKFMEISFKLPYGLDANIFGILVSIVLFFGSHYILNRKTSKTNSRQ